MKQEIISYLWTKREDIYSLSNYISKNKNSMDELWSKVSSILHNNMFTTAPLFSGTPNIYTASYGKVREGGLLILDLYDDGVSGRNLTFALSLYSAIALSLLEEREFKISLYISLEEKIPDKLIADIKGYSFIIYPSLNVKTFQCIKVNNPTLDRIFFHNLKEQGIIHIEESDCLCFTENKYTPILYPVVGVINKNDVKFPSNEFSDLTLTDYAQNIGLKFSNALSLTFLDMMLSPSLISESYNTIDNNTKV